VKEHLPEQRSEWPAGIEATVAERELLERYVGYSETPDLRALERLLSEDVRFSMPPQPGVWQGRDVVVQSWVDGGFGTEPFGSMRCLITRANRQPAVACYIRRPGDDAYAPLAIDVLRIADGAVADIVTFDGSLSGWFGLPEKLQPAGEELHRALSPDENEECGITAPSTKAEASERLGCGRP
jgi:hypothetical protein